MNVLNICGDKCKSTLKNLLNRLWPAVALFYGVIFLAAIAFSAIEDKSFLDSFYWATVTGYTVGFGDVLPSGTYGKILCIIFIPLSALFYAFFIGNVVAVVQENRHQHSDEEQDWEADAIIQIAKALNITLPPYPDSHP